MNRRNFLGTLIGGVAASAAVRTWPFRVYSFPSAPLIAGGDIIIPYNHFFSVGQMVGAYELSGALRGCYRVRRIDAETREMYLAYEPQKDVMAFGNLLDVKPIPIFDVECHS